MELKILPYNHAKHAGQVGRLLSDTLREKSTPPEKAMKDVEGIHAAIQSGRAKAFVWLERNDVRGVIWGFQTDETPKSFTIVEHAVDPNLRGHGIGIELRLALLKALKQDGFEHVRGFIWQGSAQIGRWEKMRGRGLSFTQPNETEARLFGGSYRYSTILLENTIEHARAVIARR